MFLKGLGHIAAYRLDLEALHAGIGDQGIHQLSGNPAPADFLGHQGVFGCTDTVCLNPGETADRADAFNMGAIFTGSAVFVPGDGDVFQEEPPKLDAARAAVPDMGMEPQRRNAAEEPAPSQAWIVFSFILVTLIWGSTWVIIKDQIGMAPPGWTVTWRFVVGTAGMVALALVRGESLKLSAPAFGLAAVLGLTQFCGNFQFVYRAEHYLTSGIVAVIFALLMVPNALLSRVFLKARVSGGFLAGSVVALGGIALLLLHEYRLAPPEGAVWLGVALALGGLLSASVANVLQATTFARSQPLVPMLAWAMGLGMVVNAISSWIMTGPPVFYPRADYWLGVVYLGLIGSVVTFPLYFSLIRHMGPGRAAYNGVAVPVVAMALSTLLEGYRWSVLSASGAALAMLGLLIALSSRK